MGDALRPVLTSPLPPTSQYIPVLLLRPVVLPLSWPYICKVLVVVLFPIAESSLQLFVNTLEDRRNSLLFTQLAGSDTGTGDLPTARRTSQSVAISVPFLCQKQKPVPGDIDKVVSSSASFLRQSAGRKKNNFNAMRVQCKSKYSWCFQGMNNTPAWGNTATTKYLAVLIPSF